MTDNFEKKVAVDGPVVNEGELGSSTFSPGQVSPAGPLGLGQRWRGAVGSRKREVALRLLRGEPVELLSRQLGVEIFRLLEKAIAGIAASLKERKGDPELKCRNWHSPPDRGWFPDPLHRGVQFRLHRIALGSLSELSRVFHDAQLRDKSSTGATQKPQGNLTLRGTVHRWPSPSGPAGETWLGKTWTSRARPRLPQAHQQQLSSQNCRSCSGPPWTLRLRQFCVQGNRVRLRPSWMCSASRGNGRTSAVTWKGTP